MVHISRNDLPDSLAWLTLSIPLQLFLLISWCPKWRNWQQSSKLSMCLSKLLPLFDTIKLSLVGQIYYCVQIFFARVAMSLVTMWQKLLSRLYLRMSLQRENGRFRAHRERSHLGIQNGKQKGWRKRCLSVYVCVFGWGAELPNISLQIKPRGRHFHNFTATPFRKHENVSEENCNVYDTSALFFLSFSEGGI